MGCMHCSSFGEYLLVVNPPDVYRKYCRNLSSERSTLSMNEISFQSDAVISSDPCQAGERN